MSIISVTELGSRRSTITIENQLHFFKYFDDKIIYMYMKNINLGFVRVLHVSTQYDINLLVFCTNAESFEREKIMQVFSTILNLVMWQASLVRF